MRTTVRIDDDLLRELKRKAQQEKTSLTKLVNLVLRKGIAVSRPVSQRKPAYREKTYSMGVPLVDLTKALALAAQMEDDEILEKMARRK